MESNLVLQANFIPNPFTPVAGSYAGLFYESNGVVEHHNAGFFTVKVTEKAAYSCKLIFDGDTISGGGKFNLSGQASRTISRAKKGKGDVEVSLALDWSTESEQIVGRLSDGSWVAEMLADKATYSLGNPANAWVGSYTMLVPRTNNYPVEAPGGFGYGTITNTMLGLVKFSGGLGDGVKAAQTVSVSKEGQWPLYAQLYKSTTLLTNPLTQLPGTNTGNYRGALMGWVTFTNQKPQGTVSWIKGGDAATTYFYPEGYTNVVELISSVYQAPGIGQRALAMTNGTMTFGYGNLPEPIEYGVSWASNNVLSSSGTLKPTFTLSARSGLLKGTFPHPQMGNAKSNYTGVLLQEQNYSAGVFQGTNQSGSFLLQSVD
jgi:hypothetical protein